MGAYASGNIADVEFMRIVCFIAETFRMGWLQAYKNEETKWRPYWALTLWTETTTLLPVSRDPSVTQDPKMPTDNASMTSIEMSRRHARNRKEAEDNFTPAEYKIYRARINLQKKLVTRPIAEMKKNKVPNAVIDAYRTKMQLRVDTEAPPLRKVCPKGETWW
jgi:hypothetical protein